jgi:RNA polymerase sigma-70 factor (ECF subfamily)
MDDPELGRAFARRESWAYETAYRRFGSRMFTAALRVLKDSGNAQDCVHEVMLHLWKRGDAYRPQRGSLEAFLVVCARNSALGRLRRLEHANVELTPAHDVAVAGDDRDPIESARIARAIADLTPLQATAIDLAYYRGLTHTEIASKLDEPIGTVKSRIAGALRALRKSLTVESAHG